jgi:hypothetical protein|tara:strand:- start:283 stop:495 length:213 start_codon:yes stop_codon:yes gene_type:complete
MLITKYTDTGIYIDFEDTDNVSVHVNGDLNVYVTTITDTEPQVDTEKVTEIVDNLKNPNVKFKDEVLQNA